MSNSNLKTTDFKLLSTDTKIRIKSLIEKKLTMQTIALFAQEYESLDFDTRREINLYIKFLMELELQDFLQEFEKLKKENKGTEIFRRQVNFEEKQRNIKHLQSLLNNSESTISNSYMRKEKYLDNKKGQYRLTNNIQKASSPKKEPVEKIVKVKKIQPLTSSEKYKEALKREKKQSFDQKNDSYSLKLVSNGKEEIVPSNAAKKTKLNLTDDDKKTLTKKQKNKPEVTTEIPKAAKEVVDKSGMKDFSSVKSRIMSDEDYQKEQREKERLWNQIYGKSKKEVADYSEKIANAEQEHNKIPNILGNISGSDFFTVGNKRIDINEVVDPKNPMFSFWQKVKVKSKTSSLVTYFSSVASYKKQMKVLASYEQALSKMNNASKPTDKAKKGKK